MEASGVRVGVGEDDSNENGVIDGTESHSIGLAGRTTAVLQAPTDYEGIYETWNLDITLDGEPDTPWHFGTSSQYPALTADLNENESATWQEFGYQVRGGLTLTAVATEGQAQVALAWTQVSTSPWSPAPDVTYTLVRDDGTTEEAVEKGTTALRYTDTDVTTGATYTYRVTALLDGGEAIRSAPVSVIAGEGNQPPVAMGILEDLFLRVGAGTGTVALSGGVPGPGQRHPRLWGVLIGNGRSHRHLVSGPIDDHPGSRRPGGDHRDCNRCRRVEQFSDSAIHGDGLAGERG